MIFYRWVIDPNILISYCISARLDQLPSIIAKYNLEFCASDTLVLELTNVINRDKIRKYLLKEPDYYIDIVKGFISLHDIQKKFEGGPDANDDYLVDIVQQTDSTELVTGDKLLMSWKNPPIQIISWKNFQLTYPL